MAKTLVTLHFHAEESFGPVLDAARNSSTEEIIKNSAPFSRPEQTSASRILPALLRLPNSLGVPVLLSMSNERLIRALADPAEHKALSDGVSRGRILPTPAPAFGAELRLLAPFEVADELRLNIDLWKMAMITPPFASQVEVEHRAVVYDPDPAQKVAALPPARGKAQMVIGIDLGSIERSGDPDAALTRVTSTLKGRKDFRLATPTAKPHGWTDRMLGELLSSGQRYPAFDLAREDRFDVGRDGFPVELARQLATVATTSRTFARHGAEIADAAFDISKLEPKVGRGLLLRRLTRAGAPDGVPVTERVRASFQIATILLDSLIADEVSLEGNVNSTPFALAAEVKEVVAREYERSAATLTAGGGAGFEQVLEEGRKLRNKLARLVPKKSGEPMETIAFARALRKLTVASLAVIEKLAEPYHQDCLA